MLIRAAAIYIASGGRGSDQYRKCFEMFYATRYTDFFNENVRRLVEHRLDIKILVFGNGKFASLMA